jgi:hypothetical protein
MNQARLYHPLSQYIAPVVVHRTEAVFHRMQGKSKREDAGLAPVDDSRYGTAHLVEE